MNLPNQTPDEDSDLVEQAIAEYLDAVDQKVPLDVPSWLARYESIRTELVAFLQSDQEFAEAFSAPQASRERMLDATWEMTTQTPLSAPSPPPFWLGPSSQVGPYQLRKLLGAGGMGRVFEAQDPTGTLVAVKVLSPQWKNSTESLQRFKQEGKIASTINHPRCVFVREVDEDQGNPYIVMELMTGKTLKDLVQESGMVSVSRAVQAILDVLDGLEEAHSHGMIHRDIKPANCYLESNGRVKLGDFGLARSIDDNSDLTRTGEFVGTPLFASPEQVKGQAIDARSDIYSICATLYYLLAGQAPFAGNSPTSVIAKIVSEDPTPLRHWNPQVPTLLERIVMRGLKRDPKARQQTVAELKEALEPFVTGRNALAAWGRRFAAFCLDSLLTAGFGATMTQVIEVSQPVPVLPLATYLCFILPVLVYHFALEGVGSASLGKRLLRLQIVNRKTGEKPSRRRMVFRTLSGILLLGVLTDLTLYALFPLDTQDPQSVSNWIIAQWTGYTLSYAILLSPMLFHRRYRILLHDWISGTMVVDRPSVSPQQSLAGAAAHYRLPLLAASSYPTKLGELSVTGLIATSGTHSWLAGRDERLGREVWILLRPNSEPEFPATRRQCARSTRLRWLTNGSEGSWQWDAFLATSGAPLKHWSAPESPLNWKTTRAILKQLLEELEHSSQEGSAVNLQSLDQLWMDSRGRMVLVDWSPSDARLHPLTPSPNSLPNTTPTRELLCETARQALCGKSFPIAGPHPPISAVVPLHVRELLATLSTDPPSNKASSPAASSQAASSQAASFQAASSQAAEFQPAEFLLALESHATRATEPTFENRLLGLGILAIPGLMLLGAMASLARIGNLLILEKISDQMVAPVAVEWLLENESQIQELDLGQANGFPSPMELRSWLDQQPSLRDLRLKEYNERYDGMDSLSRLVAEGSDLQAAPQNRLEKVSVQRQGNRLIAMDWKRDGQQTPLDMQSLKRIVKAPSEAKPAQLLRRSPFTLLVIGSFPMLLWIGWAGLTSGGLSMWISGLRIVQADGSPAPFLLRFLRAVVAGLPFLALQAFMVWNDLHHPDRLWASDIAQQIWLWLFFAYAIFIVAFPRRAPHDWLLGTCLVPK